jgi:hypothetical protein
MELPFVPAGLLLALAVLGGTLILFGLALKALDWTIDASRDSALGGIVSGFRDWRMTGVPDDATAAATEVADATAEAADVAMPGGPIEETAESIEETADAVHSLERVAPDRPTGRAHS